MLPTSFHHVAISRDIIDDRKELTESLQHARNLAATSIQNAQKHYKKYYAEEATSAIAICCQRFGISKFPTI